MTGGQDWMFWMTAGTMVLAVAAILLAALLRGRAVAAPAAAYDLRVYRDQLAEIDRDAARGMLGAEEAQRLRTEVSRRVLEADRELANTQTGTVTASTAGRGVLTVAGLVVVLLVAAFWGYWQLGVPGYADMPMKARIAFAENLRLTRPSQTEAEAQMPPVDAARDINVLMEKLRAAVAERPDDLQGLGLLARNEAGLGNLAAAVVAQKRIIDLKGDAATPDDLAFLAELESRAAIVAGLDDTQRAVLSVQNAASQSAYAAAYAAQMQVITLKGAEADAEDHAMLAELMILAAGGYVSPQAEVALSEALKRDAENGTARYYWGLMLAQIGRPDTAFTVWRNLLESSSSDDPWAQPLLAQIEELASMAGVAYGLPASNAPGPSAGDVAAAAEMSDADRQAMIESMVAQLNDRLASEGGTAAEWARLIGAYGVLGQPDNARRIWAEAQTRFAGKPDDLAVVRASAETAGVAE